ncbi:MAG: DASS family sodium-coupled anion symporter [Caldilineaceae bacterium]|nr:DASS family sodium-coupled anion symporter [Caldilineaceae bacterium]
MAYQRSRLKSSLPRQVTLGDQKPPRSSDPEDETPGHLPPLVAPPRDEQAIRKRAATRTVASKRRIQRRVTPLAVLQQPLQASVRKVFDLRRFLLVLGLTGIVYFLPRPVGLSEIGYHALVLAVFTASILVLEPAPLPIAALMVPIAQIALGIDVVSGAFRPFSNPVVFLILGSLFLAEALRKHGLTRRLALYAIAYSGGELRWLLLALMLMTGALSMWVLNTAVVAVLIPVAITIAQQVKSEEHSSGVLKLLILGIAYGASIGAMSTPLGGAEIAIAVGLLSSVQPFGFIDWMKFGLPLALLILPMAWFLLLKTTGIPNLRLDTTQVLAELQRTGTLRNVEKEILVVLLFSVTLWVGGPALEKLFGLPATVLSSAVVAIAAVVIMSIEEIVDWDDLKGVNWGVFFVIGAGLTLGDSLDKTGASVWLAQLLAPLLQHLPYALILSILIPTIYVLTQFTNSVTWAAILTPMLITLGEVSGIGAVRLVVPMTLTLTFCFLLPISSARMTLVSVTGAVPRKDMFRTGLAVGVPSVVVVWLFFQLMSQLGLI